MRGIVDALGALSPRRCAARAIRDDAQRVRHGITCGTTICFFAPWGNRLETFGGYTAYQMDPDCRVIKWTQGQIGPASPPTPWNSTRGS